MLEFLHQYYWEKIGERLNIVMIGETRIAVEPPEDNKSFIRAVEKTAELFYVRMTIVEPVDPQLLPQLLSESLVDIAECIIQDINKYSFKTQQQKGKVNSILQAVILVWEIFLKYLLDDEESIPKRILIYRGLLHMKILQRQQRKGRQTIRQTKASLN